MEQLTKRQRELAAKLHDHVLRAVIIFGEAHKEEFNENGGPVFLKGISLAVARIIIATTDTEEDAIYNAEVFANELVEMIKALKSKTHPEQQ